MTTHWLRFDTCVVTTFTLVELGYELLLHLPYSPDFDSFIDFFFKTKKITFWTKKLCRIREVIVIEFLQKTCFQAG